MATNGTTGHETEAINVQDLKASLQKFKTDKVDPKVTEGYYYNKKFYKEAAHTTEITGVDGRIYIDKDTNREYRFDGTKYVLLKSEVDGSFVSEGTFAYRPTAGALDVESGAVGEGGAQIECIKGNTIAWNQNSQLTSGVLGGAEWSSLGLAAKYIANHKMFVSFNYEGGDGGVILFTNANGGNYYMSNGETHAFTLTDNVCKEIVSEVHSFNGVLIMRNATPGDAAQITNAMFIDLTLIYGEGNEPTTPEQFEADYQKWFGKPLTYEEYDEGSLRSVEMTGIKTVGFNQWDEEWEVGYINPSDGSLVNMGGRFRSKNFNPCLPNATYYVTDLIEATKWGVNVYFYDANKNFVSYVQGTGNTTFTTPSNCLYFKFSEVGSGSYTKGQICINLSHSGDRNGDYEPYWEHTASLPVTSLKGKLNGEGSSVVIFPDGMKKAGTVYDEIVKRGNQTVAIKRIGQVDLGSLTWANSYDKAFRCSSPISDMKSSSYNAINIISSKYPKQIPMFVPWGGDYSETYSIATNVQNIFIADSSYDYTTDAATFKAAMNGVILYYELATPQEYIIDDIDFPTEYPVDDYGTEEILADSAKSLAPTLDIRYGLNATDTLRNLPSKYVSAVEEQNFTEAQKEMARKNIGAASQEEFVKVKKMVEAISPKVDNDYYVDMGLPSGLLWAKRNTFTGTGNDKGFAPSEYSYDASFFSWGNKEGHNPISSSAFDYDFGSSNDGPYASTDGAKLTGNIPLSQDAARYNCGEPWRMPTSAEFQELFDNCDFIDANGDVIASTTTNKLITMNSTVGIRLKSKINGNILFFPCSSRGNGTSWNNRGKEGGYWSGSFFSAAYGWNLLFNSGGVYPQEYYDRFLGFAVRPVM